MATLSESLFPPSNRRRCNKGRPSYVEPSDISVPNEERHVENAHSSADEKFIYDSYLSDENLVEEDETEVDLCAFMMENPELAEPSVEHPIDTELDSTHSKFRVTSCELDSTPIVLDDNLALNSELANTEAVVSSDTHPNLNSNIPKMIAHTALENVVDNLVPGKENVNFVNGQKLKLSPLVSSDVISKFMKDVNKVLFAKKDLNFASLDLFGKYPLVKCERFDIGKFMKNNNTVKLGNWPYIPPKKSAKFKTTYVNKSNATNKKLNVGNMTTVRKPIFKKPKDLKPKINSIQTKTNFNDFFDFGTKSKGIVIKTNRWEPEITHSVPSSNRHLSDSRSTSSILFNDPHRTKSREPSKLIRIFNTNNSDNSSLASLGTIPDRKQPFITSVQKVGNQPKTFKIFKQFETDKSVMPSRTILPQSLLGSSQPVMDNFTVIAPCDYEVIQPYVEEEVIPSSLNSSIETITKFPVQATKTQSTIVNNNVTNSNKIKLSPNYFSPQKAKLSPSNSQNIMLNAKSLSVSHKSGKQLSSSKAGSSVSPKICNLGNNENVEDFTKLAVLKAQSTVEDAIKNAVSSGKKKRNSKSYEKKHEALQSVGSALKESALLGCQTYNTTLNDILFGCGSIGIDEYADIEGEFSEDASASADADAENVCSLNSSMDKSFDKCYSEFNLTEEKVSYSKSRKKPQRYSKFKKKQRNFKSINVSSKIKLEPMVDSDTLSASECGDNSNEANRKSDLYLKFKDTEVDKANVKKSVRVKGHDDTTSDLSQNIMCLSSYDQKRKNKRLKNKFLKRRPKLVLSFKDVSQYQRAKKPVSSLKTKRQKLQLEHLPHVKTDPISNDQSESELSSATHFMEKPFPSKGKTSHRTKKSQKVTALSEIDSCLTSKNKKMTVKSKFSRRVKGGKNETVTSEDEALSSKEKLILDLKKISGKSVRKEIDNSRKKVLPTDSSKEVLSLPLKSLTSGKCSYKSKRLKHRRKKDTISEFKRSTEKFKLKNRPLKVLFKKPKKENKSSVQTTEKYDLLENCKNAKKNNKILNSTFRRKKDTNTPVTNTEEENSTESKSDVTSDFNTDMSKDFESLDNDSQSSKKDASIDGDQLSSEMSDKLPQNCLVGKTDVGDSINSDDDSKTVVHDKSKNGINNCVGEARQASDASDQLFQNVTTENIDMNKSVNATVKNDTNEDFETIPQHETKTVEKFTTENIDTNKSVNATVENDTSKDFETIPQHETKTSENNTNELEYNSKVRDLFDSSSDESSDGIEGENIYSDNSSLKGNPIKKYSQSSESDTSDSDSDTSLKNRPEIVLKKPPEPTLGPPGPSNSNQKYDSDIKSKEDKKSEEKISELKNTASEFKEHISEAEESASDAEESSSDAEESASEAEEKVLQSENNVPIVKNISQCNTYASETQENPSKSEENDLQPVDESEKINLISERNGSESAEDNSESEDNFSDQENVLVIEDVISESKECVSQTEENVSPEDKILESKECVSRTEKNILSEDKISESKECVSQTEENILSAEKFSESNEALKGETDGKASKSQGSVSAVEKIFPESTVSKNNDEDVSEPKESVSILEKKLKSKGNVSESDVSEPIEKVSAPEDRNLKPKEIVSVSKKRVLTRPALRISEEVSKRFRRNVTGSNNVPKVVVNEKENSYSEALSNSSKNSDSLRIDLDISSEESNSAEIVTTIATVHASSDSDSKSSHKRKGQKFCIDEDSKKEEAKKKCPKIKISMLRPDGSSEKSDELSNWYVSERKNSTDSVLSDVISEKAVPEDNIKKETISTSLKEKSIASDKAATKNPVNSAYKNPLTASVMLKDDSLTSQAKISRIRKCHQEDMFDVITPDVPRRSSETGAAESKVRRGRKRKTIVAEDKTPCKSETQLTVKEPKKENSSKEPKKENSSKQGNESLSPPNDNKKRKYSLELVTIPFKCGWMREVVHRGHEAKNGQRADVYYFSPEGVKLRSVPEVTSYLKNLKDCKLTSENFTFAKERIYREPFEVERSAKQKSSFSSPAQVKKVNKTKIQVKLKNGSKEKVEDLDKDKGQTTIEDASKDEIKTKISDVSKDEVKTQISDVSKDEVKTKISDVTKSKVQKRKSIENKGEENSLAAGSESSKKSDNKIVSKLKKDVAEPVITPSRPSRNIIKRVPFDNSEIKQTSTSLETRSRSSSQRQSTGSSLEDFQKLKRKDNLVDSNSSDGKPLSTKRTLDNAKNSDAVIKRPKVKYTPSKNDESLMPRPCTFRCLTTKLEFPSVKCAVCLCLFHRKCLPSLPNTCGFTFACKFCSYSQSPKYEVVMSGTDNPNIVVIPQFPEDLASPDFPPDFDISLLIPDIILDGVSSNQDNFGVMNPHLPSPPPLERAPEFKSPPPTSVVLRNLPCPPLKPAPNFDKSSNILPADSENLIVNPSSFNPGSSETSSFTVRKGVRYIPVKFASNLKANSAVKNISIANSQNLAMTSSVRVNPYEPTEVNNTAISVPASNARIIQQSSQYALPYGTTLSPHTTNIYGKHGLSVPPAQFQVFRASNPRMPQKVLLVARVNKVQNRPQLLQSPSDSSNSVRFLGNTQAVRPCNPSTCDTTYVPRLQGANCTETFSNCQLCPQSSLGKSASSCITTCHDPNCKIPYSDCALCSQSSRQGLCCKGIATSAGGLAGAKRSWDMSHMIMGYECLNLIFKWLNINDLLRASQVCRSWRYLASQSFLWESVSFDKITITDWERCCKILKSLRTKILDFRGIKSSISTNDSEKGLLCNLHHLQSIKKIVFGAVSPSVLSVIGIGIPKLLSLECQFLTSIDSEENPVFDFASLRYFEKLCDLKIGSPRSKLVPKNDLVTMPPLSNLRELSLTAFQFKRPFQLMYVLKDFPQLVNLELGDCDEFTSETYRLLGALTQLKKLRLENGSSTKECDLCVVLEKLQSLEVLELMNFRIPDNLSQALKKLKSLNSMTVWPDLRSEEAKVYFNTFNAVSEAKHLKTLCWGIIAEGDTISSELTMKNPGKDDVEELTFEILFARIVKLLPMTKVEFKCCTRSSWTEFCNMRK